MSCSLLSMDNYFQTPNSDFSKKIISPTDNHCKVSNKLVRIRRSFGWVLHSDVPAIINVQIFVHHGNAERKKKKRKKNFTVLRYI